MPRSTTEAQWSSAATPASPLLLEGFVALAWVVTLESRMIALATPPRALIVDPMEAKVLPLARAALFELLLGAAEFVLEVSHSCFQCYKGSILFF